ncbi:sugar transferase [Blastococcus sp. URHD0036]|uniref:sugar transferase n=1 Tax=Blastococcus sp. URHD0036 TaxID=1380356 RepID=UPI0004982CB9|nr:sugar transferase [Blastococcus sp. URHD0036]
MSFTSLDRRPQPRPRRLIKPLVDGLAAVLLLLLAAPWLVLITVALWLADDGPLLERDRRIGPGGRPFSLLRFRTCPEGPHGHRAEASGVRGLVRRTHLDELPQLFNVVRGDVSLVGPRASRSRDAGQDLPGELKPGLIGLTQRGDRAEEDPMTAQRYAQEWSLRLDAVIVWRALRHALRDAG